MGEYGVDLFVSHHIEELPSTYWQKHVGADIPTNEQVIGLLALCFKDEDLKNYDFTLPGDVTNYVLSVSFDESGEIAGIEMES